MQTLRKPNTVKRRNHYMLFAKDSPFKGKREQSKVAYRRKSKHPTRED